MATLSIGTLEAVATVKDQMSGPLRGISDQWGSVAAKVAVGTAAITAAAAVAGTATRAFADFEGSMNKVRAVSGATGDQMNRMGQLAMKMGASTKFSAKESADALGFLAMAGLDAEQAMTALPGTLELAAAGSLELGRAADITTNIMSGFGLAISDLPRLNDVLAVTAASANTNVEQLGSAMKFVAPVAAAAGLSIEETAAALGLLADAGIQAEMGGTALRGMITKLLNQSGPAAAVMEKLGASIGQTTIHVTDAAGKMLPLEQIIEQLERSGMTAGEAMTIFGQRAGPGMLALVSQGSEALRQLEGELEKSGGAAKQMADIQLAGLYGAFVRMSSAVDTLQIAFGARLAPAIQPVVDAFTRLIGWVTQSETALTVLAGLLAGTVVAGIALVTSALWTMLPAITAATGGINLIIPVLVGVSTAIVVWRKEIVTFLQGVWNKFVSAIEWARAPLVKLAQVMGQDVVKDLDHMKFSIDGATESMREMGPPAEQVTVTQVEAAAAAAGFGDASVDASDRAVTAQDLAAQAASRLGDTTVEATDRAIVAHANLVTSIEEVSRIIEQKALETTGRWRDEWHNLGNEIPSLLVQDIQSNPKWSELQNEIPQFVFDPPTFVEKIDPAATEAMEKARQISESFADKVAKAMLKGQTFSEAMTNAFQSSVVAGALSAGGTRAGELMAAAMGPVLGSRLAGYIGGALGPVLASLASGLLSSITSAISGARYALEDILARFPKAGSGGGSTGTGAGAGTTGGGTVGGGGGSTGGGGGEEPEAAGGGTTEGGGTTTTTTGGGDTTTTTGGGDTTTTTGGGDTTTTTTTPTPTTSPTTPEIDQQSIDAVVEAGILPTQAEVTLAAIIAAANKKGLADGGLARGMTLVGERGPEVVDFRSPGRVYSNEQLAQAIGDGGPTINISIDVNGGTNAAEIGDAVRTASEQIAGEVLRALEDDTGSLRTRFPRI